MGQTPRQLPAATGAQPEHAPLRAWERTARVLSIAIAALALVAPFAWAAPGGWLLSGFGDDGANFFVPLDLAMAVLAMVFVLRRERVGALVAYGVFLAVKCYSAWFAVEQLTYDEVHAKGAVAGLVVASVVVSVAIVAVAKGIPRTPRDTAEPGEVPLNKLAVASLIAAVPVAPVGVVLGHVSLHQITTTGERGRGLAIAGLVIGYSITVVLLWFAFAIVAWSLAE